MSTENEFSEPPNLHWTEFDLWLQLANILYWVEAQRGAVRLFSTDPDVSVKRKRAAAAGLSSSDSPPNH